MDCDSATLPALTVAKPQPGQNELTHQMDNLTNMFADSIIAKIPQITPELAANIRQHITRNMAIYDKEKNEIEKSAAAASQPEIDEMKSKLKSQEDELN